MQILIIVANLIDNHVALSAIFEQPSSNYQTLPKNNQATSKKQLSNFQ